MSLLIPGHHTDPLARDLHFVIPMCPSWIVATISWRMIWEKQYDLHMLVHLQSLKACSSLNIILSKFHLHPEHTLAIQI